MGFFKELYVDDLKPNWMRLPIWRWQAASQFLADPTDNAYEFISDPYLREASALLHAQAAGEPGAELHMLGNAALINAIHLFHHVTQHGGARWQIEALLLGGISDKQLNGFFPTKGGPRTIKYFRKLFFDVDDYLDNQHAILANVISVAMSRHETYSDYDLPWKMLGYALGWEKFCEFLKHYAGHESSREMKQFLQEFSEVRMLYYQYTQVLNMRTAFQDRTLEMFSTSLKHYSIPDEDVNSLLSAGALDSCKELLGAVQSQWKIAKRKTEFNAIEIVRSGSKDLNLKKADVKQLEAVYAQT